MEILEKKPSNENYRSRLLDNKKGLTIWTALVVNMMLVFIQRLYIGVMPDYIMQRFTIDIGKLAFLTSAAFYGYAFFQIPAGILIDKVGVRKLNLIGTGISLLGSIIFSFTYSYSIAWLSRFMIGAGTSVVIISIMKVQAVWFKPQYFSLLSSVMAFISNIGMFAGTLPLAVLIKGIGAQNTLHIISVINLMCLAFIAVFVKEDEKYSNVRNNMTGKEGFFDSLREVLTNKNTYPSIFIIFFFISTMTSLMGLWAVSYLTSVYGITKIAASGYTVFFTLGFIVGAPVISIADRWLKGNYRTSLIVFTGAYAALWAYVLLIKKGQPDISQLPAIFFMMGIVIMVHLLAFTAAKDGNKIENSGVATSVVNTMEFIGSGIINFIIAFYIQKGHPPQQAFAVILFFAAGAFISSFFVRYNDYQKGE